MNCTQTIRLIVQFNIRNKTEFETHFQGKDKVINIISLMLKIYVYKMSKIYYFLNDDTPKYNIL